MPFEMTKPLAQLQEDAIKRIKAKAGETIIARLPQWKQSNLTARAVELQSTGPTSWTQDEQTEWAAIQAEWAWVKSIRAQSNTAVDTINAAISAAEIRSAEYQAFL